MDYGTVHHELGHVYNFLLYEDQPSVFRSGPHVGFDEALGDAIALSAKSPVYLKKMELINEVSQTDSKIKFFMLASSG